MVSDDQCDLVKGLVKAVDRCFQGTTWQRYQTHFTRNILNHCPIGNFNIFYQRIFIEIFAHDQFYTFHLLKSYNVKRKL